MFLEVHRSVSSVCLTALMFEVTGERYLPQGVTEARSITSLFQNMLHVES